MFCGKKAAACDGAVSVSRSPCRENTSGSANLPGSRGGSKRGVDRKGPQAPCLCSLSQLLIPGFIVRQLSSSVPILCCLQACQSYPQYLYFFSLHIKTPGQRLCSTLPRLVGMRPKCNCVKMRKKLLSNENLATN